MADGENERQHWAAYGFVALSAFDAGRKSAQAELDRVTAERDAAQAALGHIRQWIETAASTGILTVTEQQIRETLRYSGRSGDELDRVTAERDAAQAAVARVEALRSQYRKMKPTDRVYVNTVEAYLAVALAGPSGDDTEPQPERCAFVGTYAEHHAMGCCPTPPVSPQKPE